MLTVLQPNNGWANNGRGRAGFTLVEMLVVIAITAILFTLLLRPLVTTLRLTQRAQLLSAAQSSANTTLERISRELGSAVYVFDNNSHPFSGVAAPAASVTQRLDRFTNFLDLEITKNDGTYQITHAYNAKLDFVPARHSDTGLTDPTTGEPIQLKPGTGSATVSTTSLLFPLAPGSTIIRYFIGLKRPVDYSVTPAVLGHYSNSNEGLAAASSQEDNTYILYTAQFSPYTKTGTTYDVNPQLLAKNPTTGKPELDDPDFFRYVTASDIDWLSAGHTAYGAGGAAAHNARVDGWVKIAKPVITQPDIDLLLLPHNADGSLAFDSATGTFPGVAHSGVAVDPVTGNSFPVVNTSVTFRAALISADAAPGSTTDYASLGVPADAADNGGVPYVPSLFTSNNKSWAYPYSLTLYQYADPTSYTTNVYQDVALTGNNLTTNSGDILEYRVSGGSSTPVYDVTQNVVLKTSGAGGGIINTYVPLSLNPDTGTINFAAPALPAPANMSLGNAYSPYARFWKADPTAVNNGGLVATHDGGGNMTPGVVDLTQLFCDASGTLVTTGGTNTSPLPRYGQTPTGIQCANAIIVPGSVRVYGPDSTAGPSYGTSVLYTQVSGGTELGFNQYRVDYVNKTLTFDVNANPAASASLPTQKANATAADPVLISFDYQANLAGLDSTQPISTTNLGRAYRVKIDYQTRDLLDVNIGVRVYDPAEGHAVIIPVTQRVKIGNTNR